MKAPDIQPASVEHAEELHRLKKTLKRAQRFNLIIIEYNDQSMRRQVFDEIKKLGQYSFASLNLSPGNLLTVSLFEDNLRHLAQDFTAIHLYNLEGRTSEDDRRSFLQEINLHRERIADSAPVNILFWVLEYQVKEVMTFAPDLWAWNSAVIRFHNEKKSTELEALPADHAISELNILETRRRIESLMYFFSKKDLFELNKEERTLLFELVTKEDTIDVARLSNNLAMIYKDIGDLDQALVYAKKAVTISEKILPSDHPVLATSYNNLALIYRDMRDLEQALVYAKKNVTISEKNLTSDHPSLATSYNNIAIIYQDIGDLEEALVYEKKTVAIREKILSSYHPLLATSYNNLAVIYHDMGDLERALFYTQKALAIREKILPYDHPLLATSYNNIAVIYKNMGDLEQALEYKKKSLAIEEKVFKHDHPQLATSYNNIAVIYKNMGDLEQALVYAEKAHEICEKKFPANHPHCVSAKKLLDSLHDSLNLKKQPRNLFDW